jgi:hypothetical protein
MSKLEEIIAGLEARVRGLENDLNLNASMLARQCDLARDAEVRVKELEDAIEKHHYEITLRTQGFDNDWVNKELYAHLAKSSADIDKL